MTQQEVKEKEELERISKLESEAGKTFVGYLSYQLVISPDEQTITYIKRIKQMTKADFLKHNIIIDPVFNEYNQIVGFKLRRELKK